MSEPKSFLKENWSMLIWLIAAVFAAGGIYAEFTSLKMELRIVHERLDKKIILISSLEERIYILELSGEYEKGLRGSIK
tara:strand:- start:90 stop:326 length:237 start_codon:yes stop_codon:yes gene_type:complete